MTDNQLPVIAPPSDDLQRFVVGMTKVLHDEFFMLGVDNGKFEEIIIEIRDFHPQAGPMINFRYMQEYGVELKQEFMDEFSIPQLKELMQATFRLDSPQKTLE